MYRAERVPAAAGAVRVSCLEAEMSGLSLIYSADRVSAFAGETIVFTAWVINESPQLLERVELVPGSFTNEALEHLSFLEGPEKVARLLGDLCPGESSERTFTYTVQAGDVVHGGELVSAMRVKAYTPCMTLWDEHDATVTIL